MFYLLAAKRKLSVYRVKQGTIVTGMRVPYRTDNATVYDRTFMRLCTDLEDILLEFYFVTISILILD